MQPFTVRGTEVRINIFAKPNAKKTALLGMSAQALLVSIHAKPHQGAANQVLISFLAELFQLPKSKVVLLKGEGCRYKQVVVPLTEAVKKVLSI